MCGLIGGWARHSSEEHLRGQLSAGMSRLAHRGPDDRGQDFISVAGGMLALGHTRLSIIDLSTGGHQPMHSPEGRYTIIFNGEIYNYCELRHELKAQGHAFRTDSDTEVLLAAWSHWGLDSLPRLQGMFAFAIFDHTTKTLTLVRDAFGIKPLFYWHDADGIRFASEIPALLQLIPRKPALNLQRAYDYLVYGSYDNGADTFFEGVLHLPPGHLLEVDLRKISLDTPRRWWWPSIVERTDLSFEDAATQLRELFLNNIRLHLRSDVPLGAALSGGVDSSAVVCAMRHLEPEMPIHTFTFVAPGSAVDEENWADVVNHHVGAIPHKATVEPWELEHDLDDMILAQGEPFGSTSIYAQYRVFRLAREAGITVTLDGQGADELLAGYNGYPQGYLRSLLERRQLLSVPGFMWHWSTWPGRGMEQTLLTVGAVLTPPGARNLAFRLLGYDSSPIWLRRDWLRDHKVAMNPPAAIPETSEGQGRRLVEQLRAALTGHGLVQLLRHGDRDSMRWSIESRVPFLTTNMAEFLLTLPESYLLSPQGETKHIFRAAMRGIVPHKILDRRDKINFQTPEHNWLQGQGARVHDWLSVANELPFLNTGRCKYEVEKLIEGKKPFSFQAWRLINYCRWAHLLAMK